MWCRFVSVSTIVRRQSNRKKKELEEMRGRQNFETKFTAF